MLHVPLRYLGALSGIETERGLEGQSAHLEALSWRDASYTRPERSMFCRRSDPDKQRLGRAILGSTIRWRRRDYVIGVERCPADKAPSRVARFV